eukprot:595063-Pyramimonas_sp.AAC.1
MWVRDGCTRARSVVWVRDDGYTGAVVWGYGARWVYGGCGLGVCGCTIGVGSRVYWGCGMGAWCAMLCGDLM